MIYINMVGPKTGRPFRFSKELEFREQLCNTFVLTNLSGEDFFITIDHGPSCPSSPNNPLAAKIVCLFESEDKEKTIRLIDFLIQDKWTRNDDGHIAFKERKEPTQ